ncbi:sensor domain-containing diguanylate cyclase [Candidatus Symbiobacter mobilis]|uniref:diguanylate cyclase n=1 Tax=Candidatus Symbiobacter mobilis CR TaxID=946483 RepID=U5ND59_9BURK|nr:sensor domain-containing diguanylate cyclase [Candidatus Symbiobacter mobilis]AGX88109.1 cell cycle response regulator [Candidatus Symbiobacter mobilis CR]
MAVVVVAAETHRIWALRIDRMAVLQQKAERMADVQAVAMSRLLFDYDREGVAILVKAMGGDPDIVWATVMGEDGKIFGQLRDAQMPAAMQVDRMVFFRQGREDIPVGTVRIGFSAEAADRDVRHSVQLSLYGTVAMVLALSIAIVWSVRRVTTPLREVTHTLLQLAQGSQDVQFSGVDRPDDIGDIARAAEVFRRHAREAGQLGEERAAAQALRESEEWLRVVVDNMPVPVVMIRRSDSRVLFANRQARAMCGQDFDGFFVGEFYADPQDRMRLLAELSQKGFVAHFEALLRRVDGTTLWGMISVVPTTFRGEPVLMAGIADISDRRRMEEELRQANRKLAALAVTDGLTGVANRRRFDEVVVSEWARARRERHPLSILMIDVDFFKKYNDELGHLAGDDCLVRVAQAMQNKARRPADTVARYGGEEFVIVAANLDGQQAYTLGEELCRAVAALALPHPATPFGVVTVSVGVASLVPVAALSADDLLRHADEALYCAKSNGRNRVETAPA